MSAVQSDVARQSKVAIIGVAVVGLAVVYLAYTYTAADRATPSAINPVDGGRTAPVAESEHYGAVLGKYNVRNAAAATQTGQTYVSVFSSRPQKVAAPAEQVETAPPQLLQEPTFPEAPSESRAAHPLQPAPADPRWQERLGAQADGLMNNWAAVAHSTARVSEFDYAKAPAQPAFTPAGRNVPPGPPVSGAPAQQVVPAFTLAPALLATDIDTDESSMVEAHIPSGELAGASVYAMGYKRVSNSVDMTFTFMKWRGRSYRINAKSIDKDTMRSTLSGEVNNRYFSRVLIPALALGLGRTGQLFEQADSTTVIGPLGGVVQTRGSPTGRSVAGAMIGGVATEAGQVLRTDAAQLPVKQVLIARSATIGVRFIEPVFASDEMGERANLDTGAQGGAPWQHPGGTPSTMHAQTTPHPATHSPSPGDHLHVSAPRSAISSEAQR